MFTEALLFLIPLIISISWNRYYLFQEATIQEPLPQLAELTPQIQALLYLGLISGTLLLMFFFTPFSLTLWTSIITLIVVLVVSFFLVSILQTVLDIMRQNKRLSVLLLIKFDILLMVTLISVVELSFLFWIKDVTTYFQSSFSRFVIFYSLWLFIIAIILALRNDKIHLLKNRYFISLAILDSLLVILLAVIFLQIILIIIDRFN